ncbi:hypothetical protein BS78_05G240700 [Paspalum vaginatum]|nr:hypothetical protein BS78_05G240700 [Paspalum vaginatum]
MTRSRRKWKSRERKKRGTESWRSPLRSYPTFTADTFGFDDVDSNPAHTAFGTVSNAIKIFQKRKEEGQGVGALSPIYSDASII